MIVCRRLRSEVSSSLCRLLGIKNNDSTEDAHTIEEEVEELGEMGTFFHEKLQSLPDFEVYSSEFIDALRGLLGEKRPHKKMKIQHDDF